MPRIPYSFQNGMAVNASQFNANFEAIEQALPHNNPDLKYSNYLLKNYKNIDNEEFENIKNYINWEYLSCHDFLENNFIQKYLDFLHFEKLIKFQVLTEEILISLLNKVENKQQLSKLIIKNQVHLHSLNRKLEMALEMTN